MTKNGNRDGNTYATLRLRFKWRKISTNYGPLMSPMPKPLQIHTLKRVFKCYNPEQDWMEVDWEEQIDSTLTLPENRRTLSKKYNEFTWYPEEDKPRNKVEVELKRYSYESGGQTYYYFKGQVPSDVDVERLPEKTTITLEIPKKEEEGSELPPDIEEIFD